MICRDSDSLKSESPAYRIKVWELSGNSPLPSRAMLDDLAGSCDDT